MSATFPSAPSPNVMMRLSLFLLIRYFDTVIPSFSERDTNVCESEGQINFSVRPKYLVTTSGVNTSASSGLSWPLTSFPAAI